jgi:predicted alpha/beta hydrolase family esterase
MIRYFTIPGFGNSGPQHWQTYFERSGENFQRIEQEEWNAPACKDWILTIDKAITGYDPATIIFIGHSLGCATIAHWAKKYNKKIKAAMLVAPSDIESPHYTFPINGFNPIPKDKINFPTIVIASADDQWVSLDRAKHFADNWGSKFINIGNAGHINAASGHYEWQEGLEILKTLGCNIQAISLLFNDSINCSIVIASSRLNSPILVLHKLLR